MKIPFIKMNGAGNDFVVTDIRKLPSPDDQLFLSALSDKAVIRRIAARDNAVTKGCDQLIAIVGGYDHPFMLIYNADGEEVASCGNATRCVGWLLMEDKKSDAASIQTRADTLHCTRAGKLRVMVDMGEPRLANEDIPVAEIVDRKNIPVAYGALKNGIAVGMGNPHVIYFVADAYTSDLDSYGETIEKKHTDVFPAKVNVSAAQIIDTSHIKLRVWERGAGFTQACGTAACATLVAASEKGLTGRKADIEMPGGVLTIEWREDDHVMMTGPVEIEFEGVLDA